MALSKRRQRQEETDHASVLGEITGGPTRRNFLKGMGVAVVVPSTINELMTSMEPVSYPPSTSGASSSAVWYPPNAGGASA